MKKGIVKTEISFVILSEGNVPIKDLSEKLKEAISEALNGECILGDLSVKDKVLTGKVAIKEILKYNSDPIVLSMDDDGNHLNNMNEFEPNDNLYQEVLNFEND